MRRSKWKGNFIDTSISRLTNLKNIDQKLNIWSRRSVIPAFLINKTVFIHNGKDFKKIKITREKIGFKFGEFCLTRKYKPKTSTN
jgi:ribosomal protein S19